LNKQVGGELGICEITVKAHRGPLMRKMQSDSLPNLVTMAARLGLQTRGECDLAHRNGMTTRIVVPRPGALSNSNVPFN
jgi:hypothetical protein